VTVTQGLVVSLGLVIDDTETCNGVIVRVTPDELAQLDWRERDYERTDVTNRIRLDDGGHGARAGRGVRVMTYVPRPSAVERYEEARDRRQAGIRQSYWELVSVAFGDDHLAHYESTPPPDVPIVDMALSMLP